MSKMLDSTQTTETVALLPQLPTLTVVVPTREDFHGAYFTVMSLIDHHDDYVDEIIIVDNSLKDSEHATLLKQAVSQMPKVKYDRIIGPESSCRYKDRGIRQAASTYVICCDSHVLFPRDAIKTLLAYYAEHPDTQDLIMGPICAIAGKVLATQQTLYAREGLTPDDATVHHGVVCRGGNLGAWATDPRGLDTSGDAYEIQQNGTGAFSCRKAAWIGWPATFNGHGGNETFLMESFRQNGGRVLCLPGFRWTHRFGRLTEFEKADGTRSNVPYEMSWEHKASNYLTSAVLLDSPQLYDAAKDHLQSKCPKIIAATAQKIPRPPGLWETLSELWFTAGGDRAGAIPQQLFHTLRMRTRGVTYTLEFGSGLSTLLFDSQRKQHVAIEHDASWYARLKPLIQHDTTQLLHSPLQDGAEPWYSWRPSDTEQYDLVLIDGPPGTIGRAGCRHYLADCLAPSATIILDDTHRADEQELSTLLSDMYGFTARRVQIGGRAFDILMRTADTTVFEFGAGTELKRILKTRWNMEAQVSCGCNGKMREMNYRGLVWCENHIDTIVGWLHEGAKTWSANQEGLSGTITRTWLAIVPDFAERAYLRKLVLDAIAAAKPAV